MLPQISQKIPFRASKRLRKFRTQKTAKNSKLCYNLGNWKCWKRQLWGSKWDRWVATNIHLDDSSPLRKQWSQFRWVHPWDEEAYADLGLLWAVLQSLMCPKMVGSMVDNGLHWTLGASKGMGECCASKHCFPSPWYWCKDHIRVVWVSDGSW